MAKTCRIACVPGDGMEAALSDGVRTVDVGGRASRREMGEAAVERLSRGRAPDEEDRWDGTDR